MQMPSVAVSSGGVQFDEASRLLSSPSPRRVFDSGNQSFQAHFLCFPAMLGPQRSNTQPSVP